MSSGWEELSGAWIEVDWGALSGAGEAEDQDLVAGWLWQAVKDTAIIIDRNKASFFICSSFLIAIIRIGGIQLGEELFQLPKP